MSVVALIPARGGSKRIPRKNMQEIGGISLVALAIRTARQAGIQDIYVSTEDSVISNEALRHDAASLYRPPELAGPDVPMEDVVRHAIFRFSDDTVMVLLEPTAPLRVAADILAALVAMSACRAPAIRLVAVSRTGCHGFRYLDAGLASVIHVGAFRRSYCLFPEGTILLHRGDARSIDVDEPADLERARTLAAIGG